jgi:hypothetical protein
MEYAKIDRTASNGRASDLFPFASYYKLSSKLVHSLSDCYRK